MHLELELAGPKHITSFMYPKDDTTPPAPEQRKLKRRAFTLEEDIKI